MEPEHESRVAGVADSLLHVRASRSVWDAGGIRWKAASVGKRTVVQCSRCGGLREAAIERTPVARPSSDNQ
jgi:hypothetical protein